MKNRTIWMLALLCAVAQGVWAQRITWVSTEGEITSALSGGNGVYIKLSDDIFLSTYLNMNGRERVTIDLNGHKLYRSPSSHASDGHVIYAFASCDLTLISSVDGGSVEGGKANNGGAIHIPYGSKVTADNVIFQNNSAADHAGAIWNNGTFEATNCTFKNNTANDVGAVYNSVTSDGAGIATLTNCTFTGNKGTAGAGALANALGATVMTIDGCTITDNIAGSNGGGIWNGGTLNMKGVVKVTGNKRASGSASNVFLKAGKVITVASSLTGSSIGVDMENLSGTFTSGYNNYNNGVDPTSIFTTDYPNVFNVILENGEACLAIFYIERTWDSTNEQVVNTRKTITDFKIDYADTPEEGQYKEVTNAPDNAPNEWFQMGGYSNSVAEYYVVRGKVNRETIVVLGKDVHLILCDNATLTLTGGLKLEDDHKLYIHCQSYGENMGRLMVTNKYDDAAGIGSARHEGEEKKVGNLIIYGGHIEATGGKHGAGIGSCSLSQSIEEKLCKSVIVYGGYVKATGGDNAAGIGGGQARSGHGADGADFVLWDGTVIAKGNSYAAGIGGGGGSSKFRGGYGGNVTIFGGTLQATGGSSGAGIGGSCRAGGDRLSGGEVYIYGGNVTASGGKSSAGIGGSLSCGGAILTVSGGKVTAYGGTNAAAIGGGDSGIGGNVTITGGTVIAQAGYQGGAIGPGKGRSNYGLLTIGDKMMVWAGNNGSVENIFKTDERMNACWFNSNAEISPCTHHVTTYTVSGNDANGTHTKHCSLCYTEFDAEPHDFDGNGECGICHFKGTTYAVNIYLPDANDDDTYTTDGAYKSYTYYLVEGTSFTLPGAPQDLQDMMFAGWLVTTTEGVPSFSSYMASDDETLKPEGTRYTLKGNTNFVARYKDINISLADDSDNYETIYNFDGKLASSVTLTGRTFYKDGNWNTLCLPFAVPDGDEADGVTFSGTPFEGATVLTLDNATLENSTLTLNFQETTTMEPGKPYLIKWANDTEHPTIVNPVFHDVTISNTSLSEKAVVAGIVSFTGHYAPMNIGEEGDPTILYLGTNNTFCYPDGAMGINAFRAFFQANTNLGDVNSDGTFNVTDVTLLVDNILGKEADESFIFDNADITRDDIISVSDVTALTDIILGGNSILKVVVNGADGLTFRGSGSGPARISKDLK